MTAKILILKHSSQWKTEFEFHADAIRAVVGELVTRIDHIGSTAIPGLAAKDVIDIQLTLVDLNDERALSALTQHGYRLNAGITQDLLVGEPAGSPDLRKRFLREPSEKRRIHLHVREQGKLNQTYPLLFRDYLRADPVAREAYGTVKRELAARFPEDVDAYYAIKDPYMDTIYQAAKLWAQLNRWKPDDVFR